MKINNIALQAGNTTLVLSFRDPNNANPYRVKAVTGLDADELVKNFYGAGTSGRKFYEFKLRKREVVANIGLNPRWAIDEDYSALRDDLYRIASSSRSGEVVIKFKYNSTVVATLKGNITKMEASHFEKLPDVTLTISCIDPLLRAPSRITVPIADFNVYDTTVVDDLSTAPHGFDFGVIFKNNTSSFQINGDDWRFRVESSNGFNVNDILYINNDLGPKSIYLKRGVNVIQLADKIVARSIWPILFPGSNHFTISGTTEWYVIKYTPTYWGV